MPIGYNIGSYHELTVDYSFSTAYAMYFSLINPGDYPEFSKNFKVKLFEFQEDSPEDWYDKKIKCKVTGLDIMSGQPVFVQDKGPILRDYYQDNEVYSFVIDDYRTDRNDRGYYHLKDSLGFTHRLYFNGTPSYPRYEEIKCKVIQVNEDKGILSLTEDTAEVPKSNEVRISNSTIDLPAEGQNVEYKSSIVFPATTDDHSVPDIDKQINKIISTIAGMMNASGGSLYIGVKDNGTVCGIESDLPYLNTGERDPFKDSYKPTQDHYEIKIRNSFHAMCEHANGALLKFTFENGYCKIDIEASPDPVFIMNKHLYQRCGNQTRKIEGMALITYLKVRCAIGETTPDVSSQIQPVKSSLKSNQRPDSESDTSRIWEWFTFYQDGTWSFQKNKIESEDIISQICILHSQKDWRLVLCYDDGFTNFITPNEIRTDLGTKKRSKRLNKGIRLNAELLSLYLMPSYDLLGAVSEDHNDIEHLKIHAVGDFNTVKSIDAKGYTIISAKLGSVKEFIHIPIEHKSIVEKLIVEKAMNTTTLGVSANSSHLKNEIDFVKALALRQYS